MALQYVVGGLTLTDEQKRRADVDGNGKVDAVDAMFILQYVEGLRDAFPVCEDNDNDGIPNYQDPDDDNDGFTDTVELYIGTDPLKACGPNAWPLDINNDRYITVGGDVSKYTGKIGAKVGDAKYDKRLDLNADGYITVGGDVAKYTGKIGQRCQ
jgi:hypothetical protein